MSNNKIIRKNTTGFTLVELLIVIVVIAILAAITIVSYNGIQARARDAARQSDIRTIAQALENYYTLYGSFPEGNGSTTITTGWNTTADASWKTLETLLKPVVSKLPSDPQSTPNTSVISDANARNYAYFSNRTGTYCGVGKNQMYIIVYRTDSTPPPPTTIGECTDNPLAYGGSNLSYYRVVKK